MQIGFNSRFLLEMLNHLNSTEILLEMSIPNRAGILTPIDGLEEGEEITMLVMPAKDCFFTKPRQVIIPFFYE